MVVGAVVGMVVGRVVGEDVSPLVGRVVTSAVVFIQPHPTSIAAQRESAKVSNANFFIEKPPNFFVLSYYFPKIRA
jgi:hypothetical protein